jgi:hypothetical protein
MTAVAVDRTLLAFGFGRVKPAGTVCAARRSDALGPGRLLKYNLLEARFDKKE